MHLESQALDKEQAGEVGGELADVLSAKCITAIADFPASVVQRAAIARIVARRLREWQESL